MTPTSHDRSMVEGAMTEALDIYIVKGSRNEKQLARLAKDLIDVAGDDPRIVAYINMKAAMAIGGEPLWT